MTKMALPTMHHNEASQGKNYELFLIFSSLSFQLSICLLLSTFKSCSYP